MNEQTKGKATTGFIGRLSAASPDKRGTWIIFAGAVAVVVSIIVGANFVSPILIGAALAPFFYGAMKKNDLRGAWAVTIRWGLSVFVSAFILCSYFPGRTVGAMPFAGAMVRSFTAWLSPAGSGAAPFGPAMMVGGLLALSLLSLVTGGLAAIVVAGGAIGGAACVFSYMMRHGYNIVSMTFIGLPPWIIVFALSALLMIVPAALPFYRRIGGTAAPAASTAAWRRYALAGGVLALAGIVLYLAFNGTWSMLLHTYTVL